MTANRGLGQVPPNVNILTILNQPPYLNGNLIFFSLDGQDGQDVRVRDELDPTLERCPHDR